MDLFQELMALIAALDAERVPYALVGGLALAVHGAPRATKDIDLYVRPSSDNAERVMASLDAFGFGKVGLTQADFEKPEQVHVRHILTLVKLGATDEEKAAARKKAEDLLERVRKGEDFARLAGDHSDDPLSKPKGGDIGFIARGVTVPAFDKTAFALEPGKVSGIVETPSRYHIIKVEEKKKAEITPYREIKEEVTARALQSAQQDKVNSFIEKSFKDSGVRFYNAAPDKKN